MSEAIALAHAFMDKKERVYAKAQDCQPEPIGIDDISAWVACYIDLDYQQAFLVGFYGVEDKVVYLAILNTGEKLQVERVPKRFRSLYYLIPWFGEWVSELIDERVDHESEGKIL